VDERFPGVSYKMPWVNERYWALIPINNWLFMNKKRTNFFMSEKVKIMYRYSG
jgi:hypothetical protein